MNLKLKLLRLMNFWPPFFFTGIKIEKISKDYRHIQVKLKLRFWNANILGTQYGGSIYSMADPFYMAMLMKNLGPKYSIWDKSACIRFLKPGRFDLYAEFILSEEDIDAIHKNLEDNQKLEWTRKIDIKDKEGTLIAEVDKVISIKKKSCIKKSV